MFDIQEELKKLPQKPGVYIMKDEKDTIIYVGKAINLRNRVRQYFQPANQHIPKIINMVPKIRCFEYIVTDNEVEALVLECNLIKKHYPQYNVLLKDDKSYPYIKITTNDDFPRIFVTRNHTRDKAKYLGPYVSTFAVHEVIELLHTIWPLRDCKRNIPKTNAKDRPCLNYHIGKCAGPCNSHISFEDYQVMVNEAMDFLNGKHHSILKDLETKMTEASENLDFEKAAEYRDKFLSIKQLEEKQKLDSVAGEDQDVLALARAHDEALVQVFFIRGGKMMGREHFMLKGVDSLTRGEILNQFITQYYSGTPFIPKEIIIETEINDKALLTEWLSNQKGQKVSFIVPLKGEKLRLLELAGKNAILTFEQFGEKLKREQKRTDGALDELKEALKVDFKINRIEAYDISNTMGYESVASMIVFENGKSKSNDYRKFKIKSVIGANDYASLEEVITRRFTHYIKEKQELLEQGKELSLGKFTKLPDILFIDGGKGQVSVVEKTLEKLGMNIAVCGMIKDDKHNTRGLIYKEEEIYLSTKSEGFKLLTRIQDEVHRFAIDYHRKLRAKTQVKSILDDIPGIGATRRKALIKHFTAIEEIKKATIEELNEVPNINKKIAEEIYNFFRK